MRRRLLQSEHEAIAVGCGGVDHGDWLASAGPPGAGTSASATSATPAASQGRSASGQTGATAEAADACRSRRIDLHAGCGHPAASVGGGCLCRQRIGSGVRRFRQGRAARRRRARQRHCLRDRIDYEGPDRNPPRRHGAVWRSLDSRHSREVSSRRWVVPRTNSPRHAAAARDSLVRIAATAGESLVRHEGRDESLRALRRQRAAGVHVWLCASARSHRDHAGVFEPWVRSARLHPVFEGGHAVRGVAESACARSSRHD
jgi:hypothetical protein